MSYDLKNYKILGYTTDFQQCDCCGKDNLKGTISILDIDHEVVLHFGSTCAINADKYDTLEAYNKAKKDINSLKRHMVEVSKFAAVHCRKCGIPFEKFDAVIADVIMWTQDEKTRFKSYNFNQWL